MPSTPRLPIVFVGSSSESRRLAQAIQNNLSNAAHVQLWTQAVFQPSDSFLEGLLNECQSADFAVMVLSPDDITKSRNIVEASPRDNIIFEAGLFMGALGRKRVFLLVPKNSSIKKPSDLSGITMLEYTPPPQNLPWEAAMGLATNTIEASIKSIGCRSSKKAVERPSYPTATVMDLNGMPGKIFKNSDDPEFVALFEELFIKARKVIMIGTGFNILHSNNRLSQKTIYKRIRENRLLEIYAANPYSPNVEIRLVEEEVGSPKPTIGKRGLIEWWQILLGIRKEVPGKSKFILRFFPFYPTYALFVFDDNEYFFYPYGYTQLGTLSPVLHYSRQISEDAEAIRFLDEQYQTIKARSADAERVLNLYSNPKEENANQLAAFAVYLIPPLNSPLYRFGSKALRYDVRAKRELAPTPWHGAEAAFDYGQDVTLEDIGPAFEFGLHITIADALYCAYKTDIDLICEEVKCVARQFDSFVFPFTLEENFPNEKGIALVCDDKTGSLEALHFEMVSRVYRKAVASNYSLGIASADRDSEKIRADLMVRHYHAPYIIKSFKPHFSLLSNVPQKKKDLIYAELKTAFEKEVQKYEICMEKIAVMCKPSPSGHWEILKEYNLGDSR